MEFGETKRNRALTSLSFTAIHIRNIKILINKFAFDSLMQSNLDIDQLKRNMSLEYFETFEPEKQLKIINNLNHTVLNLKALEEEFPPKHMESLFQFLEQRLDEMQIIYNIRTNKKLDEFFN